VLVRDLEYISIPTAITISGSTHVGNPPNRANVELWVADTLDKYRLCLLVDGPFKCSRVVFIDKLDCNPELLE
jgi:hypothetical protein